MNKNGELKEIYTAYNNALDMLEYRNYNVDKFKDSSIELFNKKIEEGILEKINGNNKDCFLLVLRNKKITKKDFLNKLEELYKSNSNLEDFLLVVLTYDKHLKSFIKLIEQKYSIDIQIFLMDELQMNILKHELQPEFILLSDDEKVDLLTKYDVSIEQLPNIKLNDPVTRYFNAKIGDIFKIIRKNMVGRNKTSGQGIYYRIVVE